MSTTGIRIDVTHEIHKLLLEEQKKRSASKGKSSSLSSIVLEYFTFGLKASLAGLSQNTENNENGFFDLPSAIEIHEKATELEKKAKELEIRENSIVKLEKEKRSDETNIRIREKDFYNELDEFYEKKDNFISEREKSFEKLIEISTQKAELKFQMEMLNIKDEEIKNLKKDIDFFKNSIISQLDSLDENSESNIWHDWVIPILPSVLIIISYFLNNQNIKSIKDIKPFISDIEKLFDSIEPEKRKEMFEKFKNFYEENKSYKNKKKPRS